MDVLLRELREGADGIAEYYDTEISAAELTLGSGADQRIQLLGKRIAAQQAIIRKSGQQLELQSRTGKITVNDKPLASAKLAIGDVIKIGGHTLTMATPPGGFDIAIELKSDADIATSEFEGAFRTDLHQTWIGKRGTAWLAVALLLLVGLVLPMVTVRMHRVEQPVPAALPSDALWTSGPLSAAHRQATGERCDACHKQLFERVQDQTCLSCHQTIHDHVPRDHLKLTKLGEPPRCAVCHREHNEPESYLVHSGDRQCVDCHGQSESLFAALKIPAVNGFSRKTHPAFKPHLLLPRAVSQSDAARLSAGSSVEQLGVIPLTWFVDAQPLDAAREQTNLKFSHQQHLDPDRVLHLDTSQRMVCADCHQPEPDGQHFVPIRMEARCSSCHELTFDQEAPERQLPHAKPREVVQTLQDYFTRKYLDPQPTGPARVIRRLPGHDEDAPVCPGSPLERAKCSTRNEIEAQFLRRGCVGCHVVNDSKSAAILERFQVYPIRFARDYFPAALFDHRSHQIQDKLTGDAACLNCHTADKSMESTDVLMPALTKCEACHGDQPVAKQVGVQCISCHEYHPFTSESLVRPALQLDKGASVSRK